MIEILSLAHNTWLVYITFAWGVIFVGVNFSLVLNANIFVSRKQLTPRAAFKHFTNKHLSIMLISLIGHIIGVWLAYDFDSLNPFYMPVFALSMALLGFVVVNVAHMIVRAFNIYKHILKDEMIECGENYIIIIYCCGWLNIIVWFVMMFLDSLLFVMQTT